MTQFKDQNGSLPVPLAMIGHSNVFRNEEFQVNFWEWVRKRFGDKIQFSI